MTSIKEASIFPEASTSPSSMDELIKLKKKQEHSNIVNARHHSLVGNFDRKNEEHQEKYYDLLRQYEQLHPDEKPDADFHGKPPSKERYKKLQVKIRKHHKNLEKESEDEVRPIARKKPTPKKGQISPEY